MEPIQTDPQRLAGDDRDYASIENLTSAVEQILPALEQFTRFDQPEQTALNRAVWSAQLDEPLPQQGSGQQTVLNQLRDVVIPNGLRAGDPAFSGWIATMPTTVPAVAHLASALAGPLCVAIQSYNFLETLAQNWLKELVGLPMTYQGLFTSGGSVANLIGIGAARQYAFEKCGIDPARDGVNALPMPRIYTSDQVHHVTYRAASVLGLGRHAVVTIPSDETFQFDVAALRARFEQDCANGCTPIAVVASAGTINTGAVDPLAELAAFCREKDVWFHVDGAYGLLGILDPTVSHLYGKLADCDSLVVDPHKWLATSMGCGAVYVRDEKLLERAFTLESAVYLEESQPIYSNGMQITSQFDDMGYVFHNFGVEHSLPSRGVEVWAVLKEIGVEGIKARICRHNYYARYLAERLQEMPQLELMAPVTLSTCCYRYVPDVLKGRHDPEAINILNQLNREVLRLVHERGLAFPSATVLNGAFVIRACFINPRTLLSNVKAHATEVEICGARLWESMNKSASFSL